MAWFDCAIKKPISANTSGSLGPNLGLILHHAVANGSLYTMFNNPASQVSAHFWVAKNGTIEQYVDSDVIAWHAIQLNDRYCGVETEGCVTPPYAEPMTDAMVESLGTLYAEGMRRHGWANALANADGQLGFGYHRMAVNTACPCDVRLARRQDILDIATGNLLPVVIPPKGQGMIAATSTGRGYWCVTHDGAIYAYGDATKPAITPANPSNQPFGSKGGDRLQPGVDIVGIAGHGTDGYWLYASDGSVFAYGSAPFFGRPDRY